MKLKTLREQLRGRNRVIATFGAAILQKSPNGKWRLEGGSRQDRLAAQEWISLFLHEAVV